MRILNYLKSSPQILIALLFMILLTGMVAHGFNMFNYPFYDADEGTYISQAWAVNTFGKLSPYIYLYDHAPAGWLLISLWAYVTGGYHVFGFPINSGRMLMLILQGGCSLLLFFISRKIFKHRYAGLLALALFMFSPLSVLNHRKVLLDNIMTFWVLLSLYLGVHKTGSYLFTILSGIALGIGVLTKETALAFIPAFLIVNFYIHAKSTTRLSSALLMVLLWALALGTIVSLYPMYALSQGQLFENDSGIWLLKTFSEQLKRGRGSMLDLQNGFFWISFRDWTKTDPVLLIAGLASTLANLILGLRYRYPAVVSLFSLAILAYLGRGGLVFSFYIIPLLPFLALNTEAFVLNLPRKISTGLIFIILSAFTISAVYYSTHINGDENLYTFKPTEPQIEAAKYLKENAPFNSGNIIENYAYVYLNDNEFLSRKFEYYWKAEFDGKTREGSFKNDYKNVTYILASPNLYSDIDNIDSFYLVSDAVRNSSLDRHFENDGWYVDIRKVISQEDAL